MKQRIKRAAIEAIRSAVRYAGFELVPATRVLTANLASLAALSPRDISVVFDLGAHEGGSYRSLRQAFPTASIYSFEPATRAYESLKKAGADDPLFFPVRSGIGAATETRRLYIPSDATESTFLSTDEAVQFESVPVATLDGFCKGRSLSHIDLLKLDVEGSELDVLRGAAGMLANGSIGLIFAEVSLIDDSPANVHWGDLRAYLLKFGFASLGIYDIRYWRGRPKASALFVRKYLSTAQ